MNFRKVLKRGLAIALTGVMLFQAPVMAATPEEELLEIFAHEGELESTTMLSQALGLDELKESVNKNGYTFQLDAGLTALGAALMNLGSELPNGGYLTINSSVNTKQRAWLWDFLVATDEAQVLDLNIYGDENQLTLSIPQFYVGGLVLKGGNLKELYANSGLAQMIGTELTDSLPDIDLSFYPGDLISDLHDETFGELYGNTGLEISALPLGDELEKTVNGNTTIYTCKIQTADLVSVIGSVIKGTLEKYENFGGFITIKNADETRRQIEVILNQISDVLGAELTLKYVVEDGCLKSIAGEVGVYAELPKELSGYLRAAIEFDDAKDPGRAFRAYVMGVDTTKKNILGAYTLEKTYKAAGSKEESMITWTQETAGRIDQKLDLLQTEFDSATGGFNMTLLPGTDSAVKLKSTFSRISEGRGFAWDLDTLTIAGRTYEGLRINVIVNSNPGRVPAPNNRWDIWGMDETEWTTFLVQTVMNVENWTKQFAPTVIAPQVSSDGAVVGQ